MNEALHESAINVTGFVRISVCYIRVSTTLNCAMKLHLQLAFERIKLTYLPNIAPFTWHLVPSRGTIVSRHVLAFSKTKACTPGPARCSIMRHRRKDQSCLDFRGTMRRFRYIIIPASAVQAIDDNVAGLCRRTRSRARCLALLCVPAPHPVWTSLKLIIELNTRREGMEPIDYSHANNLFTCDS